MTFSPKCCLALLAIFFSFQAFAQKYSLEKKDAKDAKEYNQENDLLRYIRFVEPRLKSLYHKK
jgi:hypothetical protein